MLGRIYSGKAETRRNGYLRTIIKVPKYSCQSKLNHNNRWMCPEHFKTDYKAHNLDIKMTKKTTAGLCVLGLYCKIWYFAK